MQEKPRLLLLFAVIAIVTLACAQLSGFLVNLNIPQNTTVEINSLIHFTHVRNHGGVFGMLQGNGWLFALISTVLLLAVIFYLARSKGLQRYEYVCFGFIVGGGCSNVLDRFVYGSVIDFIDIQHIPYWHYIFNVADVMVHVGIWPMILLGLLTGTRNPDTQT